VRRVSINGRSGETYLDSEIRVGNTLFDGYSTNFDEPNQVIDEGDTNVDEYNDDEFSLEGEVAEITSEYQKRE